jgi:hypothetical protein
MPIRRLRVLLFCCCAFAAVTGVASAAAPWLVFSDVHYDPRNADRSPASAGSDTNKALLDSLLKAAAAADPDAPVVIVSGDLLAHKFPSGPLAAETIGYLATRFDAAFPHAQFVLALGNNDSACGDYETTPNDAFLRGVAQSWAPLVNRNGAAPAMTETFSRYGAYAATLPRTNLRVVVADDTFWSKKYDNRCGESKATPAEALADFRALLGAAPGTRTWVVMHIPPGIDATKTVLALGLRTRMFLDAVSQESLIDALEVPAAGVTALIAGHTHRFSYRMIRGEGARAIPVLVAPAVSPIYGNGPSFLTLDVGANGTIGNVAEYSLVDDRWRRIGSLGGFGVTTFDVPHLLALQKRLHSDVSLRNRFLTLYAGAGFAEPRFTGWQPYWCAAEFITAAAYRSCLGS